LDEPEQNQDEDSARDIIATIMRKFADKTIFIISHYKSVMAEFEFTKKIEIVDGGVTYLELSFYF